MNSLLFSGFLPYIIHTQTLSTFQIIHSKFTNFIQSLRSTLVILSCLVILSADYKMKHVLIFPIITSQKQPYHPLPAPTSWHSGADTSGFTVPGSILGHDAIRGHLSSETKRFDL